MHGLLVWGIATLLTGIVAAATLQLALRTPGVAAATPSATVSVPGESIIAYDLDRLFRGSEKRTGGDLTYDRAEAARILFTASSHTGMETSDRAYLVRLISADTGLAGADAEHRVDEVAAHAKQDISRARNSAVILAFMAGAAALLGAMSAWMAAAIGGRYRDGREAIPTLWDWGRTPETRRAHSSMPR
jgi:predicted transcriptional regulator